MNSEQFRAPKGLEKVVPGDADKNKKINELVQECADLGAINLNTVPADEYASFKDEFLQGFKGTDDELEDAIQRMHERPVYSEDGSGIVAYQVYEYADTSDFSEEQAKKLDDINERMIELTSGF